MLNLAQKMAVNPLLINDMWIAAHALESGSVVITYDAHFKTVPGLRLWEIK
jgi:tRNA(fMet)-specific endonuclease VapC